MLHVSTNSCLCGENSVCNILHTKHVLGHLQLCFMELNKTRENGTGARGKMNVFSWDLHRDDRWMRWRGKEQLFQMVGASGGKMLESKRSDCRRRWCSWRMSGAGREMSVGGQWEKHSKHCVWSLFICLKVAISFKWIAFSSFYHWLQVFTWSHQWSVFSIVIVCLNTFTALAEFCTWQQTLKNK